MTDPTLAGLAGRDTAPEAAADAARRFVADAIPAAWREAAERGGPRAVRTVRTPADYREWYPAFGHSGLVAPTWAVEHGGLGWSRSAAAAAEAVLRPYHLPRLNPLGLNLAAPVLFAHGTEDQRRRFLPPIVRAEELWCQLLSEPGAGSDLASLATRAERDGDGWVVDGQKVWTTWADQASFAVLLARTDPDVAKHAGLTFFFLPMHQPGVTVRPLPHIGGETDFFETFMDGARIPDDHRIGEVGDGWAITQTMLNAERQMVTGAGVGGVERIGGTGPTHLVRLARRRSAEGRPGGWDDPAVRDRIVRLWAEDQARRWTNQRIRSTIAEGRTLGPEASIGKVQGTDLNQRIQSLAAELLGPDGIAWDGAVRSPQEFWESAPAEVRGMLRSRANTIEGGTTEVNKNVIAERVLGLPKEADPYKGRPWRELPRS
ncbi:acyl-CoA dehydrogenase family protein [Trujillonella endophytica]|uniref:Acyl-CoA dehydrogenase n=1 Tax=Trujillonella endophytica TaxID=673521 RepID=A0A1H8VX70_9ACTN|nr:acyl-CoA dehydrogenase family protein [Trujillella endophytica]SEP20042.1 Acyl-CoA dehydrogenase [Trujillella endophytica]